MEEKSAQEKVTEAYQSAKAKVEKFAADERVQVAKGKVADAAKVAREKAKAFASSENIAKAKERLSSLKSKEGRAAAFAGFMALSVKARVLLVCVAVLAIWMLLKITSCAGGLVLGSGCAGCKSISDDINLILTTLPDVELEKGVGYEHWGLGFKVLQCLPQQNAVIAVLDKDGNMGFSGAAIRNVALVQGGGFLGGGLLLQKLQKEANPIFIRTKQQYVTGKNLEQGIYVYEGIVTYETARGSMSVRAFSEVDPAFSKQYFVEQEKKGAAARKQQEEEDARREKEKKEAALNARLCDGEKVELPADCNIRSICGLDFGTPPKALLKNLGKMTSGDFENSYGPEYAYIGKFMMKDKFRMFDTVEMWCNGEEPPYRVLSWAVFTGKVDLGKYSEESCKEEIANLQKILAEKFNLKWELTDTDQTLAYLPKWEYGELRLQYKDGSFELSINLSKIVNATVKKLKSDRAPKKESLKLSENDGKNVL